MTHKDIQQVKEWAKESVYFDDSSGFASAVRVIQSLPDTVVDGDKLREVIAEIRCEYPPNTAGHQLCSGLAKQLEALLTPSLPTLADMTPEGREACQWMQADTGGRGIVAIISPDFGEGNARILTRHGWVTEVSLSKLTPRPDLPRLEWPGSGDAPTVAEHANVAPDQQGDSSESPKSSLPRPEDVPAGEAWLIAYEGGFHTALKADSRDSEPWVVSFSPDWRGFLWLSDRDVTLVSSLVPEANS